MKSFAFFRHLLSMLLFVALQVLVCNRISLFGYATPFLYVWMILRFDSFMSRNAVMLWSFVLGLAVDMFTATPGLHAAAATLTGFLQPFFLSISVRIDKHDVVKPSCASMGNSHFALYIFLLLLIHSLFLFVLKNIPVHDWGLVLLDTLGSAVLGFVIIFCLDLSFSRNKDRRYVSDL